MAKNDIEINLVLKRRNEHENKLRYMHIRYINDYEENKHKIHILKEMYAKEHLKYCDLIKINAACLEELRKVRVQ